MKTIFIHTIEITGTQILVVIGHRSKAVVKWLSKYANKEINKAFNKERQEMFDEEGNNGSALRFYDEYTPYYFLWLKDFKYDNYWLDVLNHEIVHLKQFIFETKHIGEEEIEFEANFIESLNRELRTKLMKKLKIK